MSEAAAHAGLAAGWPWRAASDEAAACVELAALPVTPYWARRHAQAVLGGWQVRSEIIETAALLVSELVTNALAVTTAMTRPAGDSFPALIVQTLRRQPGRVVIEVSDSDPGPPVLARARTDAESGRANARGRAQQGMVLFTSRHPAARSCTA